MTKTKNIFICQDCGYKSPKWQGRCPECEKWNSFLEELETPELTNKRQIFKFDDKALDLGPKQFKDISELAIPRIVTSINEFDRVLGGGLVRGSVVLVGGDPGIGKSTLMLQVSNSLSKSETVLYISGEESISQTKLRAKRLGNFHDNLFMASETSLELVVQYISKLKPKAIIIDSIQVIYKNELTTSAGSVSQIRECAAELIYLAKKLDAAVFLIGHVTKEGLLAGPRVLEHMVDTVLYFEGESQSSLRILRSTKNRFGSTNEIGIFEMAENGLNELKDPSKVFLFERPNNTSGSVATVSLEGTRPLCVEVQALVVESKFNIPKRQASGFDLNRLNLIIAILEKRCGFHLGSFDIFINVAGGVRLSEPASDLAVAMALSSSFKNKAINAKDAFIGELGLGGEIRSVNNINSRIKEVSKLGFKRIFVPKNNSLPVGGSVKGDFEIIHIDTIEKAIALAIG